MISHHPPLVARDAVTARPLLAAADLQGQAETRLAAIVESSSDAIIGKTLDGRITSWNRAAESMFGYSAAQAIGAPVAMLIPADRQAEEARILTALGHGHQVAAFDTVRLRRDGAALDVNITVSPIHNDAGRVIGASKIARDVTLQRRGEAALRDSEARLRFTLDAARIGDWELDLGSGEMRHSLRHDQCFGHAEAQAHWDIDTFLRHVHPDEREEVSRSLQRALAGSTDWRVECRVVWPDGSVHWISQHGAMQRRGDGPARLQGIVSDTTEQHQAEAARLAVQRLEAENRLIVETQRHKSAFLATMSHELRTPLNGVIGCADLLQAGRIAPDSPKYRQFLGHIGSSARQLLHLINDVLDLARVESGRLDFAPEPVDLAAVLKDVQAILHTALLRKHIAFETELDEALGTPGALVLDPARLKQVLYNVVSNAVQLSEVGGRVHLRVLGDGPDHVRFEVEDHGAGIAAEALPGLFSDFRPGGAPADTLAQASGLGLALTRQLVEAQGGQVGVRSTLGAGTTVHLVLNRRHGHDLAHRA